MKRKLHWEVMNTETQRREENKTRKSQIRSTRIQMMCFFYVYWTENNTSCIRPCSTRLVWREYSPESKHMWRVHVHVTSSDTEKKIIRRVKILYIKIYPPALLRNYKNYTIIPLLLTQSKNHNHVLKSIPRTHKPSLMYSELDVSSVVRMCVLSAADSGGV